MRWISNKSQINNSEEESTDKTLFSSRILLPNIIRDDSRLSSWL